MELPSKMPGPSTSWYSFNLPSTDGELTGLLIQSEHCQLAHSEKQREQTLLIQSGCELCRMLTLWLAY